MYKLLKDKPEPAPKRHTQRTARAWVSWIAAFSGMRLNEICSLKVSDLKREKGVWFFDVTNAKTEAGDRRIPVHSMLIKLGLLDYAKAAVAAGKSIEGARMFPALKPGGPDKKLSWYFTKAFTSYRRKLGVVRRDKTGRELLDFHSFRRSVVACLENERLPQSEIAQVVGHERAGITFSVYNPEGLNLKGLKDVVEKIKYKGVSA